MGMPVTLEVERVLNLIGSFGWELVSQQNEVGQVVLTIKKKIDLPREEAVGGPD